MESANSSTPEESPAAAPARAESVRLKQGDIVGSRFVIDERLREDVTGTMYRAVDEKSGKKIAILMMDPATAGDKAATEALRTAVKAATELAHKNVVSVFGMGKEGRRRYVAREYVDGQTLAALLDKKATAGKQFTLKGAYNLIAHVCNALQYARATLPHGTLRPSAVLINRTGRVKVSDFGLAGTRPALEARRDALSPWDAACLPAGAEHTDDLYAVGVMLYCLIVGRPPEGPVPTLPDATAQKLPTALAEVLRRCVDPDPAQRFAEPAELKAELLQVVEAARGGERRRPAVETPTEAAASIEVLDGTPMPARPGQAAPRAKKKARPKEAGGFVIPELKAPSQADDDGTVQRWLVERGGTDYGPFTGKQVVEQLFKEEITGETTLYDIETDRRLALSEFDVFTEALVSWIHEKAEREKRAAEAASEAAAKRRNRILLGVMLGTVLVVGGGAGGWAWYRSTLPKPVKAHLGTLVTPMQVALPTVTLPEELPETFAEVEARKAKVAARTAKRRTAAERRRMEEEARLAASSELVVGSGDGGKFDRSAFDRVIAGRNGRLMKCLQDEARRDPDLSAVEVHITVLPRGDLINVNMPGGTSAGSSCVRAALRGLKVPAFDGTNVKVKLPFNFR